jgi:hypothetical protein
VDEGEGGVTATDYNFEQEIYSWRHQHLYSPTVFPRQGTKPFLLPRQRRVRR